MNWPLWLGCFVFVAVPLILWVLGALANKGHGFWASILGFIVGSDNRLSLSRLQAFLWTLVIFGSFAAAMSIHTEIKTTDHWVKIPPELLALAGIAIGSGVFSGLIAALNGDEATAHVTAITSVLATDPSLRTQCPTMGSPAGTYCLLITGTLLGDGGKVRLARRGPGMITVPILLWKNDGTQILTDLPDDSSNPDYRKMTVETPNGKLTYKLKGNVSALTLGQQVTSYEFADLFRDDKNPKNLSLMKFQMFGWTVIAIFIYVYLFVANLSAQIDTLPVVDKSVVLLTGVSQTGYLAGKSVSNVSPNQ